MKPLLSICIPTYNRADLLRGCLECLAAETAPFGEEVELIVSDNCSTDHTPQVVEEASKKAKIRYYRNDKNLGFAWNIKILVEQLATGEFCWLIGDDDLLHRGAVKKVLETIKENPELNYIFTNFYYMYKKERAGIISGVDGPPDITKKRPACFRLQDAYLDRGEDIISYTKETLIFSHMSVHIFRRVCWNRSLDVSGDNLSSFATTFPFFAAIAHEIIGKPCFFIGSPYLAFGAGTQGWLGRNLPIICFRSMPEFTEHFRRLGARKNMIDREITIFFRHQYPGRHFWRLLMKDKALECKGFSLKTLVYRYWKYPDFWMMIFVYPVLRKIKAFITRFTRLWRLSGRVV